VEKLLIVQNDTLSHVGEDSGMTSGDRYIQINIGANHNRALATQFQTDSFQITFGGRFHNQFPNLLHHLIE